MVRKGSIVSKKFEKIPGLNIVIPTGSKARKKAVALGKKNLNEQRQLQVRDISKIKNELLKLLERGQILEIKGAYGRNRILIKNDNGKLKVLKGNKKSLREVNSLKEYSEAIWRAGKEAEII